MTASSIGPDLGTDNSSSLSTILKKDDLSLSKLVCERLPKGTYTSVNVRTIQYNFSALPGQGISTRVITLGVSKSQECGAFFRAFFTGFGIINTQDFESTANKTALQAQILSHMCRSNSDKDEIERSYAKCTSIDLFIAADASAIEMQLRDSSAILTAFNLGKLAKTMLPIITMTVSTATQSSQKN